MRWRMLPLFMLIVGVAQFNRYNIPVAGTERIIITEKLGHKEEDGALLTEPQMGLVYSAFLIAYTACMIPGGWFIDRFGPRAAWMVVLYGTVIFTAATGLAGLYLHGATSLLVGLLLIRGLMGMTNAPLHPTGARLVGNWFHGSMTDLANGAITFGAVVFISFTPLLFGPMIDELGWPQAFLAASAGTLVMALLWTFVGRDRPPRDSDLDEELHDAARSGISQGTQPQQSVHAIKVHASVKTSAPSTLDAEIVNIQIPSSRWRRLLTNRSLIYLMISYGAQGYFQYLLFYWTQHYFGEIMGLGKDTSRLYTTIVTFSNGAGMLFGGALSDWVRSRVRNRYGSILVPMLGLGAASLFLALGLVIEFDNPAPVLLFFALSMGTAGLSEGAYWSKAVQIGGPHGGTAAGLLNFGGNATGLVAPMLTPIISRFFSWKWGLGFGAIMVGISSLLWLGVVERETPASVEA